MGEHVRPVTRPGPPARVEAFSRDELLSGLAGRRVSTARYAIESRTAYLAQQARYAAAPAICEGMVARRERAFLSVLAAGREVPEPPTVQELERFAPQWAYLVPDHPAVRADLAHHLGAAYRFAAADAPRLRAALGLDEPAVRAAYHRRRGHALDTVYARDRTCRERVAWARARWVRRIAELPPFWAAFGLTLSATVGASLMALPIALAPMGPLPGLMLIVVLGLVNVLTMLAMAEAFTRSGRVRWGEAYLSRVVAEFLGPAAAAVFGAGVVVFGMTAVVVFYVSLAGVLAMGTGIPAPAWAALLFVVVLARLRRDNLDASVVTALTVCAISVLTVLVLSAVALAHLDPANLLHAEVPELGEPLLGVVFGVVLLSFYGHTSMAGCARVVLHREPSGRALAAGAGCATVTAAALYGLWVVAVGGAVPPQRLAGERGTALAPLAEVAGGVVLAVGAVFVVLEMGLTVVNYSLGQHAQFREWVTGPMTGPVAGLVPVVAVFALAELLLLTRRESFTAQLGLLGTVVVPLLAGIFPVLLLLAARRRGEHVPALRPRWLGARVLAGPVAGLFLAALLAHGLVIWDGVERLLALVAAALAVAVAVAAVRGGRLRPRLVVEARLDTEVGTVRLAVTAAGEPYPATAQVHRAAAGRAVSSQASGQPSQHVRQPPMLAEPVPAGGLELPTGAVAVTVALGCAAPSSVKLRLHGVDPGGSSQPLPATAHLVAVGAEPVPLDLRAGEVELTLPAPGAALEVVLAEAAR